MSEGGGGRIFDLVRRAHGELFNAPTWSVGKRGPALSFNASTQHANLGAPDHLQFGTGPFSFMVWFKTSASRRETLLQRFNYDGTGVVEHGYLLHVLADGKLRAVASTNGSNLCGVDSLAAVNNGQWHQAIAVRSGATVRLYLDGVDQGGPAPFSTGSVADTNATEPLRLGHPGELTAITNYFSGQLDTLIFWNRALSAAEVQPLSAEPDAMFAPRGVRQWFFPTAISVKVPPHLLLSGRAPGI